MTAAPTTGPSTTGPPATAPSRPSMAGSAIDALGLADLLGRWPAADGPLDRPPPLPLAAFGPRQPNLVTVGSLSKLYWGGLGPAGSGPAAASSPG